jgi:hypothetical protein
MKINFIFVLFAIFVIAFISCKEENNPVSSNDNNAIKHEVFNNNGKLKDNKQSLDSLKIIKDTTRKDTQKKDTVKRLVDMESLKDSRFVFEINGIGYKISSYNSNYNYTDTIDVTLNETYSFENFPYYPPYPIPDKIDSNTVTFTDFSGEHYDRFGTQYDEDNKSQIRIIFSQKQPKINKIDFLIDNNKSQQTHTSYTYGILREHLTLILKLKDLPYIFDGEKYSVILNGSEIREHIKFFDYTYSYDSWMRYINGGGKGERKQKYYLKDYGLSINGDTKIKFTLFVK